MTRLTARPHDHKERCWCGPLLVGYVAAEGRITPALIHNDEVGVELGLFPVPLWGMKTHEPEFVSEKE